MPILRRLLYHSATVQFPGHRCLSLPGLGYRELPGGKENNETPHMDKMAKNGLRYNNFHTTALCSPTRSCLMTGRNHQSNAMGCITEGSTGFPGYNGRIPLANGFLSEILTPFGWTAFAIGKWHLTPNEDMNLGCNRKWWPLGLTILPEREFALHITFHHQNIGHPWAGALLITAQITGHKVYPHRFMGWGNNTRKRTRRT